ncbi:MAG: hypothetical protein ACKOZU_03295 [Planctomycetaceae bacterium]
MGLVMRAATLVAAGCAVGASFARGTDVLEFNFNTGPAGWTSPEGQWLYTEEGSNEKSWKLPLNGTNPAANYLSSPCLTITDKTVRFDLQEHRFSFGTSGTEAPITYVPPAGQVQYQLDDDDWRGIPITAWYPYVAPGDGGDVPPMLDPAALAPGTATQLVADGWAFQGMSDGYDAANPKFIRGAFELSGLPVGGEIAFRLLGDLGDAKFPADPNHPIWDVNNIQIKGVVEGPCAPEPGGLALAASAAAAVSIGAWRGRSRWTRRRSRRPCSAPRETPGPEATV